jgi:hypothetical protein
MTLIPAILSDSTTMTRAVRTGGLLERIYRDVGLAAVARELGLPADDLEPELSEAVKRGALHLSHAPRLNALQNQ